MVLTSPKKFNLTTWMMIDDGRWRGASRFSFLIKKTNKTNKLLLMKVMCILPLLIIICSICNKNKKKNLKKKETFHLVALHCPPFSSITRYTTAKINLKSITNNKLINQIHSPVPIFCASRGKNNNKSLLLDCYSFNLYLYHFSYHCKKIWLVALKKKVELA